MQILLIVSLLLLITDIVWSSIKQKALVDCVSKCWYCIKWWHYALLAGAAFIMMPTMINITPDNYQFLAFFTCAALLFVATAADYKGSAKVVHYVSAFISAISAIIWAILCCPTALVMTCLLIAALLDRKHQTLWAELSAFGVTYTGVFLLI